MKRMLCILPLLLFLACVRDPIEPEPLYRQYAERQDLTVAQIKGFRLNDTVKTDVVIMVADDTAAWSRLKEDFDIRTDAGVTSWMGDMDHPRQRVKRCGKPVWRAMAVHAERTIAFYRVETESQYDALLEYQLDKINPNL